jgi:hypothetical protein
LARWPRAVRQLILYGPVTDILPAIEFVPAECQRLFNFKCLVSIFLRLRDIYSL